MARSRKTSTVRTVLPSFKLLAAGALAATAFAWYQGALPSVPGLPNSPRQTQAPAAAERKPAEAALPRRMAAPDSKPLTAPRSRLAERPGQPPRPQAILTGAIPKTDVQAPAKPATDARMRGPVRAPEAAARPTGALPAPATPSPASPLPATAVPASVVPAAQPSGQAPAGRLPTGLTPARAPQRGDCQCPYDLMLNGQQCGQRSAFLTPGWKPPMCYL